MAILKTLATIAFGILIMGASAETVTAQEAPQGPPTVSDGWHNTDDTLSLSPKPSCGRMPRDGEYAPLFRAENGVYVECRWSYQGPKKPKPRMIYVDPLGSLARALEGNSYYGSTSGCVDPGRVYCCPYSGHPLCGVMPQTPQPQYYRRRY